MKRLSVIIPARNEAALIGATIETLLHSLAAAAERPIDGLDLATTAFELIVADDGSEDATPAIVASYGHAGVRHVRCAGRSCPSARNAGVAASTGKTLLFVDADTLVPAALVARVLEHHEGRGRALVLYRLASREPGVRARLWWSFWGLARRLPLARAKSMPALMSCTRAHFERHGPFDESVLIAEEWPLTAAAYREPGAFHYDRGIAGRSSSRRMELQRLGYLRTFVKWTLVVLFPWARRTLDDRIRHRPGVAVKPETR